MPVTLQNPYARAPGQQYAWLKGNLHTHTTRSDGSRSPQAVIDAFAARGYNFLAITDHDVYFNPSSPETSGGGVDPKGMILLPGIEVSALDVTLANGVKTLGSHVLQVGGLAGPRAGEQEVIDRVNAQGGAFTVLNHPGRTSTFEHFPMDVLLSLKGYLGIEILNGAGIDTDGTAFAVDKWDRLLSAGRIVWGFANDDTHRPVHDARGWNMVQIRKDQANAQGLINAFRNGQFYASSGVTIDSIETDGPKLHIKSKDAQAIEIYGDKGLRIAIEESSEIVFDATPPLLDAMSRTIKTPFIRAQLYGQGTRMAWTQPFLLKND